MQIQFISALQMGWDRRVPKLPITLHNARMPASFRVADHLDGTTPRWRRFTT
jgi:hypothetical protein